ncbi:MAG: hypothetical protein VB858_19750 [Planctomycetaceae bacterium]
MWQDFTCGSQRARQWHLRTVTAYDHPQCENIIVPALRHSNQQANLTALHHSERKVCMSGRLVYFNGTFVTESEARISFFIQR